MYTERDEVHRTVTRAYEQTARAESAAETRRHILDGVYGCLRQEPSTPPSVGEIARRAGVARSTVYLAFGSRAGLFDAFAEDLWERSGMPNLREAVNVPDAREAILGGIRAGVDIFAADRDVFNALFAMSRLDPDAVGGAVDRIERRRAEGMAWASRRLARQKQLGPGVSVKRAAHVLWLVASFDAFDLLYTGRGLSAREVGRILADTFANAVYTQSASTAADPRPAARPNRG
jgi:AcrR family transcriptional regulator